MQQEAYWLKKLAGAIEKRSFPFDHKAPVMNERRGESEIVKFTGEVYTRLLNECRGEHLQLYKFLVTGVVLLLHKYTHAGDGDYTVGGPVPWQEQEPFNTVLALKVSIDKSMTFHECLLQVSQVIDEAYAHADYPISVLLWQLNLLSSDDEFPLFDVTVSLETLHNNDYLQDICTHIKFFFRQSEESLEGTVEYNAAVYEKITIKRIFNHLVNLLHACFSDRNIRLADIDILSEADKTQLLFDFNDTQTDYPRDKSIPDVFSQEVIKGPDHTAVLYQNSYLSYRELERRANCVAAFLQAKGILRDEPVGIMAARSLEVVVGLLGILQAGGAYLPINADYPEERKNYILQNANIRILFTISQDILGYAVEVFSLESLAPCGCCEHEYIERHSQGSDAAYIIYTSGSTGKPKGVIIEHRGVVRLVKNTDYFKFEPGERILQTCALEFDVSTFEIWGCLLNGRLLCLVHNDEILIPANLKWTLLKYDISTIWLTSPLFNHMADADSSIFCSLDYLLAGGDALSPAHVNQVRSVCRRLKLINGYGPTENTTFSTAFAIDKNYEENIPIGRPIANSTCYIVDQMMRLLPPGAPGELVVGGDGVARGYLNAPELTNEKFRPQITQIARITQTSYLYRTGDLARWLADGNIEFLGRIDQQVKIRGFRIELGEIENRLLTIEYIKEAVVVDLKDAAGEKYLCAYFTAAVECDVTGLREKLAKILPDYMIPAYFVQVEKLPLNISGKIDRKKLPDPRTLQRSQDYIAPRDKTEKILVGNWAEALHINKDLIGINDDFFKLGGHSLKAAVLTASIHKSFHVKISIRQVFAYPTISQQADYIKKAEKSRFTAIHQAPVKEYYRLSSAQKRMYFMTQLDQNSTLYNEQLMEVYYQLTDKEKLEQAFKKLLQLHESLRTSFHQVDGEAVQKIHDYLEIEKEFKIEYYEGAEDGMISSPQEGKEWTRITGLPFQDVVEQFVQPFDLSKAPLIRVGLIKILETHQVLMVDIHHIIFDGLSLVIMLEELWKIYRGEQLAPLSIQYKDFAEWSHSREQINEIKNQEEFWLSELAGEIPRLTLPLDFPRSAKLTFGGDIIASELNTDRVEKIYRTAQTNGATLFMVLLAAYNILLAKLSGQEEIIVGTVTAGRGHADLQTIIGMFVNTLALRNFPGGDKSLKQFLAELKEKTLAAFENQDYQFDQLVGKVAPRQDPGRNPLFDAAFELENESDHKEYLLETLMLDKSNPYDYKVKKSKFELALIAVESHDGLLLKLEYNTQLFKKETVERFLGYYKRLLLSICSNVEQKIAEIEMIPGEEKRKLLDDFNGQKWDCPKNRAIHTLFEEQAAQNPDNVAVVGMSCIQRPGSVETGNRGHLTYRDLNERAGQIAQRLKVAGLNPGDIVAIMVEPCQEMIAGLMAILKAGGAFLPIKDGTPSDRITYILLESGARFLLTRPSLVQGLKFKGALFYLNDNGLYNAGDWIPGPVTTPYDSAYVIYTSGSTGKPKGVMVEHRGLVNLCCWHNRYFKVSFSDRATKYAGFGFDASVWEIFPYMIISATLYIVPEEIKLDVRSLNRFYERNGITIGFLPTQMAEQFMMVSNTSLRVLQVGGDKLKLFVKREYELYNCYGPTENTVCATAYPVTEFNDNIPIGKPIANNYIYIVDKNDYLQPVGVPGELCIAGNSLARGYLNAPELTNERFRPQITQITQTSYHYRTGDLARWLVDGNIEFLGRIDQQVKIRGFRIELGEIENQLLQQKEIKESVVLAREDAGQKYLCAYIVPNNTLNIDAVKRTLSKNLPAYMIPSFFMQLQQIPLTPNGKIDARALPAPQIIGTTTYAAPTNEIEEVLAQTWAEVLGLEKIGIDNNFFEIGGDSIKTILISSRLFKWELNVNVNDFFLYPTIRELAKNVKKIERVIEQDIITGPVELTPIQWWFFKAQPPYGSHFNQSVLLSREKGFNEDYIKKIFTKIVTHHDALRMIYKIENSSVRQEIRGIGGALFDLELIPLKSIVNEEVLAEIKEKAYRVQRSLDLQKGPLVKLALFKGLNGDHLLIVIHHLVIDGISWRILLEDFETGYTQMEKGEEIKFQAKTDSFQYWSQELNEYAENKTLLKEIPYWQALQEIEVKSLPVDHEIQPAQRIFGNNKVVPMLLSEEKTHQLITKINWVYNTEINDILMTALGLSVKQWAGLEKILVNLEGHGREQISADANVSRTIGWFTTQYPVVLDMERADDISFTIKNTKEILRRVPKKGIGYGILQYLTPPEGEKSSQLTNTPEILFNYLGRFGESSSNIIAQVSEISDPCTGESVSPEYNVSNKIDIEGVTKDGQLRLDIYYNRFEYDRETIENLARLLLTNLEKVIDHCLAKKEKEFTPSDLCCNKLSLEELAGITGYLRDHIGKDVEIQYIYTLSPMQSGMLFHWLKDKHSPAYHEQMQIYFQGHIQPLLFEETLNRIVAQYDVLRTVFAFEGLSEPLQVVLKERKAHLPYADISHLNEAEREKYLAVAREKDRRQGFDLTKEQLTRFSLFKTGEQSHVLMWTFHHTLMDGWCLGIIRQELTWIYRLLEKGAPVVLEPPRPYVEYIRWLEQQDKEEGLRFWKQYLEGYEEPAGLPRMGNADKSQECQKAEHHFTISEELQAGMNRVAGQHQATIYSFFQAIWGILLQRYTNKDDVVFGAIVSGRPEEISGIERMVGLFINMVPTRIKSVDKQSFAQLLEQVQVEFLGAKNYEYLPIAEVQALSGLKADLIDHIIVFENYLQEMGAETEGGLVAEEIKAFEQTNYDFNIIVLPWDGLQIHFSYNALVYDTYFIQNIVRHFEKIISQVVDFPNIILRDIDILSEKEKEKVLFEFNNTISNYPDDKTIHQLFEEQVEKTPDQIALVYKDKQLKYNELNKLANQWANTLRNKGLQSNYPAAVMVKPSQEMIIGLLAILKAGGAFLPIDHNIPDDRLTYILRESGAKLLLTSSDLSKKTINDCEMVAIDDVESCSSIIDNLEHVNTPGDMAYIIYTSGSTGKPKGVVIEHCSLVNLCCWHNNYYKVTENDRATKYASLGFDASVWEIFPCLIVGATLFIIPEEIKLDLQALNHFYEGNGITISFLPTQICEQFMKIENKTLRILLTGGDKLKNLVHRNYRLYNNYGPTENTVVTASYQVKEFRFNIPIGKPIANNQIYILDRYNQLQPVGVPGELCIAGDSLARGYLNRPELTAERFIPLAHELHEFPRKKTSHGQTRTNTDPFFHHSRFYRTGDLARWLADGNIEFLGRIDFQVKIRGFRIELGEIENRLMQLEKIKEAVVLANSDNNGEKYLCAYLISPNPIEAAAIRKELAGQLPEYMIPAYFVQLGKMPLTPNGKLDRKVLPDPETTIRREYTAPTNETEKNLADVWTEVLNKKVGIHDNFFEFGGDSIKTILISSKLFKWGLTINVNDFFLYPTIHQLAGHVKKIVRTADQTMITGNVPLTPIQCWFFENHSPYGNHFNQSILLSREKGFNEDYIKKIFTKIVTHHDGLRMIYKIENSIVRQENRGIGGALFDLELIPLKSIVNDAVLDEIKEEANRVQRSLDLQKGPLVKLALFKGLKGDQLLIVIHHLVIDGISWRILLEDFETGYAQVEKGEDIKFPAKTDSFQYWSQELNEYACSKTLLKEIPHWQSLQEIEVKSLPVDHEIQPVQRIFENTEVIPIPLGEEKTQQLLTKTNWAYNTEINDILLAALGLAIRQWAGIENILLNLEGHGRELIYDNIDISRTVGWFTTQYPVLLKLEKADDISFTIKNIKEILRKIPKKGIGYGILQYLTPPDKKKLSRPMQAPEILFNYLGEFKGENSSIIDWTSEISAPCTGDNVTPQYIENHKLDIEGVTRNGRLNFYIFYNRYEYEKETIEKLGQLLQASLGKVIDYCLTKTKRELTPSDLGYNKISIAELAGITDYIKGHIGQDMEIQLMYPLSPMQSGMLFHWLKDKQSPAYFEQMEIYFNGDIQPKLFEDALNRIVARYDVLRTIFAYEGMPEPLQVVLKERKTHLHHEDISHLNEAEREIYLADTREKDRRQGFDLTKDQLTRFSLFKTGDQSHVLMWTFHHILMDGWCLGIIRQELSRIYRLLEKGAPVVLEPPRPYMEYIRWLERQDKEEGLHFWEQYLEGYDEPAGLPRMGKVDKSHEYQMAEYHFIISVELLAGINRVAGQYQSTINTFFQAIWGLLLQRYTNRDDTVFGAVVSGRPADIIGIERMVGLFINMVPVRIRSVDEQSFAQLLEQVQVDSLATKQYEYLPVAEIQALSGLKGDLLDHILVFENYLREIEAKEGLTTVDIKAFEQTNYDFNVTILPWEGLQIHFSYNALVYDTYFIENIARHFEKIISQVVDNPNIILRDIDILSVSEREKVLLEFNDTRTDYPGDRTIHRLFEEQVEKTPGNTALILHEDKLTYREFNDKANQLAHLLRVKGIEPDQFIGLMVERSIDMIIGMMAILKAGGAYLPIDPDYPVDRIRFLVKDSDFKIMLTQKHILETTTFDIEAINLQDKSLYQGGCGNPDNINTSKDIAYSIYTSGSTGIPKGVAIEHRSVINLAYSQKETFAITETDNILQFSSISFDASVEQIYICLFSGAALVLVDKKTLLDIRLFEKFIDDHALTHINAVPVFLSSIPVKKYKNLKRIIAGGDICPLKLVKKWTKYCDLYNHYGPTETTVTALKFLVKKGKGQELTDLPIGKALKNTYLYLFDKNMRLVPIGVPGELFIGGDGVARGYLNRPELTAERFIPLAHELHEFPRKKTSHGQTRTNTDPFFHHSRFYRTGDLTRWLPDGNIEFLGRIDQQVKIRGFRIELGEIENRLIQIEDIKDAVVIAREDSPGAQKYLCAYVISDKPLVVSYIKKQLAAELPDYMIPSFIVQMEIFPKTPSGKVDRKSLPNPETLVAGQAYAAPVTAMEELLVTIWLEVLRVEQIGIDDDFFDVGGDSIKSIHVVSRCQKNNLYLDIKDLFFHRTCRKLAKCLKPITVERKAEQGVIQGDVELTPMQTWLFTEQTAYCRHFTQSMLFYKKNWTDQESIKKIFGEIVSHHDALRIAFGIEKNKVSQINRGVDGNLFDLDVVHLTARENMTELDEIYKTANRIRKEIDLYRGPLVKIVLFKGFEGDYLLVVIHHTVVDELSWHILSEDLETAFQQVERGEAIKFPAKTDSFRYWSKKLIEYAVSKKFLKEIPYWKKIEETITQALPVDHIIGKESRKSQHNEFVSVILSEAKTQDLLTRSTWAYKTDINALILTALGLTIKQWAELETVLLAVESTGREKIMADVDVSRTVGWFTTRYPILLNMKRSGDISYLIKNVKETFRQVPNQGIGYGILKYLTPGYKKGGIRFKLSPEIRFSYTAKPELEYLDVIPQNTKIPGSAFAEDIDPDYSEEYKINILGKVVGGKLILIIIYNKFEYDRNSIEKLAETLQYNMEKIIDHCLQKEKSELSPVDYGYNKISIDTLQKIIGEVHSRVGEKVEIESIYPITPRQQKLFWRSLANKEFYYVLNLFSIPPQTDIDIMEKCFNILIDRYEVFRTVYIATETLEPLQITLKQRELKIEIKDLSYLSNTEKHQRIEELIKSDKAKGFDLNRDLLVRVIFIRTGEDHDLIFLAVHNIIFDAWGGMIFLRDLIWVYENLTAGQKPKFKPIVPFKNFVEWLAIQDNEEGLKHWDDYLQSYYLPATLSTFGKRVAPNRFVLEEFYFDIEEILTDALNRTTAKFRVTLNNLFQTIWGILLQEYTHSKDVIFGAIVSGRSIDLKGIEDIVGLTLNIIPVRLKRDKITHFSQLLLENQHRSAQLKKYEHLPLQEVLSNSSIKMDAVDNIISFQNFPVEDESRRNLITGYNGAGYQWEAIRNYEQLGHDFYMYVIPTRPISVRFSYNSLVYDSEFIEKAASNFQKIAAQIVNNPDIDLDDIEIL